LLLYLQYLIITHVLHEGVLALYNKYNLLVYQLNVAREKRT